MNESRGTVHGPRAPRAICDAIGNHDFVKGASYALMFGLLAWAVLGAVVYEALRLL